jgi:hypothetical protein
MRVSVIIPTRNEAASIGRVLADIPSEHVTEVIVVDSNSRTEHLRLPHGWVPELFPKLVVDTARRV